MPPDVTQRETSVASPVRVHRTRGVVLLVLSVFQLWLWATRIVNLLGDAESFSAAFVGVHLALYVTAIGAGAVLGVLGVRMLREASRAVRR